jgi:hypothetical protein
MENASSNVARLDGLLDSARPKDTQVVIMEQVAGSAAANAQHPGRKRGREAANSSCITQEAHWVMLYQFSPFLEAQVRAAVDRCR